MGVLRRLDTLTDNVDGRDNHPSIVP